ncbi:MAG: TonB-dependent receptor [Bacteroidales bacterium]|nr:TonB-dependent receptor [Bacteroidales bacterium]
MKTKDFIQLNCLIFLLFMINGLSAQNRLTDTIPLEEVVVTGTKIEVAQKLVPVSVSHLSKAEIESTGEINILPALSAFAPGVFVTERNILGFGVSTGGSGAISIRGVSGSPNTGVLILIDGHPQYQGIFGHPLPDAYVASDVEKVEILRGPASILYGSNAMGGVVNIITRQQKSDGLNGSLEASYGSYNTQKYAGTVGYKKNRLSVFASVNHDQTDGIRENTDFRITNGYTKMNWELSEHLQITADLNLAKFNANDNGSVYAEPEFFNIDITRGKTSLSLENRYDKTEGALKLYHNFGEHTLSDGWHSTDRNSGAMFYQTLRPFKGNRLTVGVDAKQFGGEGNSGMAADSLITINELGIYAYMQQSILQQIAVSAGLRLEHNSGYGNELVPMIGLNYNPSNNTSLKASVSKGFRSPTIMEMYLFAPNPELEPESMINYEVSWIQQYLKNRLRTELTLFYAKGDNMIQVAGQYPNVRRQNIGVFSNKGVEFAARYRVLDKLHLHANYSFLSMDKVVLAAPRQQFNLMAVYQYKVLTLNLSLQHIDRLYTSVNPETTQSYTLLNARINAQLIKNFSAFLALNNLLNEEYEINYGYPLPGINFNLGIKLSF